MSLAVALLLSSLTSGDARQLFDRFRAEPTVEVLCQAAEREANVNPERARSWMWRARAAAWLPELTTRLDRGIQYDESIDTGPSGLKRSVDTDDDTGWRIQATWDLGRIVFEPNEISVAREGANQVELRARLLQEVVRLYFERRRLQIESLLTADTPDERAVLREARIREIEAAIDVLTGGAMTRGLGRRAVQQ